jgi:hypothetical protein
MQAAASRVRAPDDRDQLFRPVRLTERARQLGWSDVLVIDDDLSRSGGGTARPSTCGLWSTRS